MGDFNIQPVILAGGVGSRLWPLSRQLFPKQLFKLTGRHTLLQQTYLRLKDIGFSPVILTGKDHKFIIIDQLVELKLSVYPDLIIEPIGRNTAPACIVSALYSINKDPDTVLLICPADHLISDDKGFLETVKEGIKFAKEDYIVTFGIKPNKPETAYGYIEATEDNKVKRFVEKPDLETAKEYIKNGNFYWNSGIFLIKAKHLLDEAERFVPDMLKACEEAFSNAKYIHNQLSLIVLDEKSYKKCPSDSIDYAILEHSNRLAMVPAKFSWSDVGSWAALYEISDKDKNNNVVKGDVFNVDSKNCLIRAEDRLVATVGLEDTVVIETSDAVLVAPLSKSQDIKKVVSQLKTQGREEHLVHKTAHRPWGSYTVLEEQPRFKIKRLTVKPGAKLSLQMHYHRSEHWIVVKGTARVTRDDEVFLLRENESTFILPGQKHRLENPGKIPLEIIEVQNGSYLGEDDIVRFEDTYGRDNQ